VRAAPSEKLETIRLVEGSSLGVKRTLAELGVPRSTFYRWYQAYSGTGRSGWRRRSRSRRFWNRIGGRSESGSRRDRPGATRADARELAWHITDAHGMFISESSVYEFSRRSTW
jgi:hypothetical protein